MNKQEIIDSLNQDIEVYSDLIQKRQQELKTYESADELMDIALDIRQFEGILYAYKNCLRRVKFLEDDE